MNYYSEAIDILSKSNGIERDILFQVAKANPGAIVKAYNAHKGQTWQPEAKRLMDAGEKIQAIKYCRGVTEWG